jgi:uncharacterized repeat protein (TIGR03803 family)
MKQFWIGRAAVIIFALCAATAINSPAQTLKTLASFNGTDGKAPQGIILATDGNFYGTTEAGGANGFGSVFKITPGGTLTTLYSFCAETNCIDGNGPTAALVQASDGNLYGTTYYGGSNCVFGNLAVSGCGTVFRITTSGQLTTLYNFCQTGDGSTCYDGSEPYSSLIQGSDGNLYGTTVYGGDNANDVGSSNGGYGTVFKMTLQGTLTTLFSFCNDLNSTGYCLDGAIPYGGVLLASDGNFYGTLYNGGTGIDNSGGAVYKLTPSGKFTALHYFGSKRNWTDGAYPFDSLIQGTDGNLYGTTRNGGYGGTLGGGTVFKITPAGALTTLHLFRGTQGGFPYSALLQGKDGKLYGTDSTSVYKVSTTGGYNVVYTFCALPNCADGSSPIGTLVQTAQGTLYGVTTAGGANGDGTVFSLSLTK